MPAGNEPPDALLQVPTHLRPRERPVVDHRVRPDHRVPVVRPHRHIRPARELLRPVHPDPAA